MKHAEKNSLYRAMIAQIFADEDTYDISHIATNDNVVLHSTVCASDMYRDTITKYVCAYGYDVFNEFIMDLVKANMAKWGESNE